MGGLLRRLNAGYGWGRDRVIHQPNDTLTAAAFSFNGPFLGGTPPGPVSFDHNGALGGFQAGYNWRPDRNIVFGFEVDFDWARIRGEGVSNFLFAPTLLLPIGLSPASNVASGQDVKSFGTIRARWGFTPTENVLIYGTAGFAYAGVDQNGAVNLGTGITSVSGTHAFLCAPPPNSVNCFVGSSSRTAIGWTAGAGGEFALWNNVSVKAEYLYMNLGADSNRVTAVNGGDLIPASISTSYRFDLHVARVGINYRFGGDPIVAKY